jgi:hypothetical protein
MEHRRFYEAGSLTDTTSIDLIWRTHRAGRFDLGFRASRNETEQAPVAVEAPRATVLHYFEARLVVAIEQLVANTTKRPLVGQLKRLGTKPLHADHRDDLIRQKMPRTAALGWRSSRRVMFFLLGGCSVSMGKAASVNPPL